MKSQFSIIYFLCFPGPIWFAPRLHDGQLQLPRGAASQRFQHATEGQDVDGDEIVVAGEGEELKGLLVMMMGGSDLGPLVNIAQKRIESWKMVENGDFNGTSW